MTLRDKIEAAIVNATDGESAAIEVCLILEQCIGLAASGWFKDDEHIINRLMADRPPEDAAVAHWCATPEGYDDSSWVAALHTEDGQVLLVDGLTFPSKDDCEAFIRENILLIKELRT